MPRLPVWMWAALFACVALLVLVVINIVAVMNKPNDETQILQALEEMRVASVEGRPGGVLEYISDSIELPTQPEDQWMGRSPKAQIARFLRQADIRSVEISDTKVELHGELAQVACSVRADLTYPAFGDVPIAFDRVVIEFRREASRRLFVVPDSTWRVVRFQPVSLPSVDGMPLLSR